MFASKGWIKFLGILMIIYGAFAALSIIGIVVAWLPIWLGVLLNKAANKIEQAHYSGNKQDMLEAQKTFASFFTIYGVIALIGIILSILAVVFIKDCWQPLMNTDRSIIKQCPAGYRLIYYNTA
jgi:multidrug efflux pump subunit AcrB